MIARTEIAWVGSSKKNYKDFPDDVQDVLGFALDSVQCGYKPAIAKPLKGIGSGVFELVDDYKGDTYRAVYAVKFNDIIYVLHAFQKKSTKGIKTPKKDIDLIKKRLKDAIRHFETEIKKN